MGAGDEIEQVEAGPERMTVAEVNALLYLPGHPAGALERALRIPAMSTGWRTSLQRLLEGVRSGGSIAGNPGLSPMAGPRAAWVGFRSLRVSQRTRESRNVTSLVLDPADGQILKAGLPGQFVVVRLRPASDGPVLLRSYSLSGTPSDQSYRISVKRNPDGAAGAYIDTQVQIGDVVEVSAPRGGFTLRPGEGPVVLLSAGVGATPVLAMLHALAAAASTREVWWIYGAHDGSEHPFAAETGALLRALAHGRSHVRYSSPGSDDRLGVDFDAPGRLNLRVLQELGVPRDAEYYLCGPPVLMTDFATDLAAWGVSAGNIHTEVFGSGPSKTPGIARGAPLPPPHPPEGPAGAGPLVSFARSGLSVRWAAAFHSILEFAEACDVPVRWACRTGVCHTCETGLINGAVGYRPDPVEPPPDGDVLICCSEPQGDIVIDL